MLRRVHLLSCRRFSGDPYMLHLEQRHDPFPQYAHLHWHTIDPLEAGKYTQLRSKQAYGSHVIEVKEPVQWYPYTESNNEIVDTQRDTIYEMYMRYEREWLNFLDEAEDYTDSHGHKLGDKVKEGILEILTQEQLSSAIKVAQDLIAEYQKNNIRFTKEAIADKVGNYVLSTIDSHQMGDIQHLMIPVLEDYGLGRPMTED